MTPPFGDLLDMLANDPTPIRADDRARIRAAIIADGKAHEGRINTNRVRVALTNKSGHLDVYPRCIGPAYVALRQATLIRALGYLDVNADHAGRNAGKPAMAYELTEAGWSL